MDESFRWGYVNYITSDSFENIYINTCFLACFSQKSYCMSPEDYMLSLDYFYGDFWGKFEALSLQYGTYSF